MMATSTSSNDRANASVSFRRQRYNAVTASRGRLGVKRVFTAPGLGAFAMITSTRSLFRAGTPVWVGDFIEYRRQLRRPLGSRLPLSKIIPCHQAENEPGSTDRPFERAADLRFSDTRIVAHRDFNHAESA